MINTTIGKYKILRLIGEGGMASVYEAEHEMLGTRVAIKVLNPILSSNSQIRERFKNEARLMASLDHPNITKVIDFDDEPNQLSIILEYLHGEDLNKMIKKRGPLSEDEVVDIFTQILSAFQYAHEKGIVHRDIKPSNIFILPTGHVKILDFGIAKLFGQGNEMTQTGTQMGTPVYMSPEQVKADKSIDHRSDIYSLGVTMYYAINGKPPYDTETNSQFDIFSKIVYEPLPDISIKSRFNYLIKKACSKNREERYQSCNEWLLSMLNPEINSGKATENLQRPTSSQAAHTNNVEEEKKNQKITENINNQFSINKEKKKSKISPPVIAILIILAGVVYYFAEYEPAHRDSDSDGVPDRIDECIYESGFTGSGCPDDDEDGIANSNDNCPEVKGNDDDGCFYYKKVEFTNNSRNKAYLCVAYFHDATWVTVGWYTIEPNSTFTYDLPSYFKSDEVYWFANNDYGEEWTSYDKKFLVESGGDAGFTVNNGKFISRGNGTSSYKWFYKLKLTSETTLQAFKD